MSIDTQTITAYWTVTNQNSTLCPSGLSESWQYAMVQNDIDLCGLTSNKTQTYKQINRRNKNTKKQSWFIEQREEKHINELAISNYHFSEWANICMITTSHINYAYRYKTLYLMYCKALWVLASANSPSQAHKYFVC